MFPLPPTLIAFFFIICILLAMGTGEATGVIASFCLRLPVRGILRDALLGLAGFLIGFAAIVLVRPLGSALINHFIDPPAVALVVAAIVPLSRKIFLFRHLRSQ